MSERNMGLDLLKVMACIGVVSLHTMIGGFKTTESWNISAYLYYLGTYSIPLFFMVNGYFLLGKKNLSYSYVFNKLKLIVFSVSFWNIVIWVLKRDFTVNPFKTILGSLVQKGYFSQFWFFGALIIIYLTLPMVKQFLTNSRKYRNTLFFLMLIGIVFQISNILFNQAIQSYVIQSFRLWTWYFYYLMGGFIGNINSKVVEKLDNLIVKFVVILAFVLSPIYLFIVAKYIHHSLYAEFFYDDIFVKIISIGIFVVLLNVKVQEKFTSFLQYLSSLIMGVFIVHTYVMKVVEKFINFDFYFSYVNFFIMTLLISFVISAILDRIPIIRCMIRL
ncbi:acyltransferase [Streptococcus sp. 10F2]